ncbi:hypothetical protein PV08_02065 [Exophiala spinifera]|uniref:Uncharacterized protein n=1 Tax=Exophiala spinifera TaxID=91928 RepID=A0A0D2BSU2_9EURO|nr:uncharacterized protein PV08_02065 [Exophiala spinifera]KIW21485.1 hypothetical protein PV08_02065 [Exophiala spinifera]
MAEQPYDRLSFILWLIWYYPGTIVTTCVLCHVAARAAEDATARKIDHSAVQIRHEIPTEARKPGDASGSDSILLRAQDTDEGALKRLSRVDEQPYLGPGSATQQENHHGSRSKTSSVTLMKIAIFWQGVQILLLERMGRMAARERTLTGDPIFVSVVILALCTTLVLLSAARLQDRWNEARIGKTGAGADLGEEMKKSRPTSRLILAAVLLVSLPWYELLTATHSP